MGSSSSKQNAASSSSSSPPPPPPPPPSSFVWRTRSRRSRVFQASCLRSRGNADSQVSNAEMMKGGVGSRCANRIISNSSEVKRQQCTEVKLQLPEELNSELSDSENDELDHSRGGCMSSRASSSRGLNSSNRFLSRLNIFRDNISFRLNRASSFGSAKPCFASSMRFPMSNNVDAPSTSGSMIHGNDGAHGSDFFPTCVTNTSPAPPHADLSHLTTSNFLRATSTRVAARDSVHNVLECGENSFSSNHCCIEGTEARLANRRNTVGETVERNVRFSRSLSVGRLRDRVLRRTSFLDLAFGQSQQGQEVGHDSLVGEGQILGGGIGRALTEDDTIGSPPSIQEGPGMPGSLYGRQRFDIDSPRSREARYHDLLEYRSNFLERRRRIRSQVRVLQRLGRRFENLSGHERSCILSGQHRRGHCTCRINPRETDSNDETSARASISRVVMLAEALFEVLDEIHQQSVVLSSRSSMSSLGSIPAPNEVVDSLPLRLYGKLQKHVPEEVAQCYICLVEYVEGDSVRILPCHHEYHKACIDKWLKEIHRVCPLCRGDVCRSDSLSANTRGH